ncbi:MAG: ribulose bisphosphate carboxylase small subunit [Roseofilum sp. SBFL]|uniref:ribulose bisphosphate carboxylase small subunit n=1 Tax=unclassified Roseofilum TaxID=2620099 RepID=UPI001B10CC19|nr:MULTISPECIES: ribulose bisphosphate carboxylase small subunit [unclassified Roseofilum]MBP0012010.1 ribulose bisphosphate carboxylase small subunit [Roseofilum sp. SID3]MBP0026129.1 ribulose bisphosphate carboxylase small subunit [Roseofilum sp. SID2]MBP0036879.1 ribulose bisphosphate carboxylase small subunit [Roseofilum sp. SID1]MBP0044219.1 ribulose bisphosphate carboxylase small subunit [Roseofilum sp. SBFL]
MTYYIAPQFLNKVAIHITKNFLDLPQVPVPLILGIHGRKGEGKTFQCELIFEKMGVEVIHMSAGELESPDAGDPSRLIRLRYREAAELIKVRGKMTVLMINDLDAGAGRLDERTQYTVNTQLVHGTLMNIADRPTDVQLPGSYDPTPLHRVPIIVTGNDFSTLYAPLIRDGRMEKFYWEPDRQDKVGIVSGIFAPDRLSSATIEQLIDRFPEQPIDFFAVLRSRLYDDQILHLLETVGYDQIGKRLVNSKEKPPEFPSQTWSLEQLLQMAEQLQEQQQHINRLKLSHTYQPKPESTTAPSPRVTEELSPNSPSINLPSEVTQQVQQILEGGYSLGVEIADSRRFRTGSWQNAGPISAQSLQEALFQLSGILEEHPHEYIRLIAIDRQRKQRILETLIQKP